MSGVNDHPGLRTRRAIEKIAGVEKAVDAVLAIGGFNPGSSFGAAYDKAEAREQGIGDINSTAKGTGARFNTGKPDLSLLPLTLLAGHLRRSHPDSIHVDALEDLGHFQETHDPTWLHRCAETLGADGWEECAHVFEYGAKKYAAWNWAKGMPWSVPLACAARHIYLGLLVGEQIDRESQRPHRGHVFCNLTMLLQYVRDYPEGNDLPPKGLL